MEEGNARGGGPRRRPPRKKPSSDQQHETQNIPNIDSNAASQQPLDNSTKAELPKKKRTRKPKKLPQASGEESGEHATPPNGNPSSNQLPVSSQAPTWQQQQSFLNVEAPDFQPNFELSGDRSEHANGVKNTTAKPKTKKKPKKPPGAKNNVHSNANNVVEEGTLLENDEDLEGEEAPHCLLCCSPMALVSFGSCGHVTACGPCCLRLRMCYNRTDCAMCKSELTDVVIAPWRKDLPDFSFFLDHPEAVARSRPGQLGPGCILADKWQPKNRKPSSKLLHDLERSTGIACSICDKSGIYPFARHKDLATHLHERHSKYACGMCLREGRTFPLDIPVYDSKQALKEHTSAAHPRCDFCRGQTFFDGDALWAHMVASHHRCHLCEPGPGGSDSWFADARRLQAHLAADHFACDDGDCAACLVAFRTAEELRRHHIERHSARMPRWNPAAARPMQLDIQFVRRPAGVSAVFSTSSTSGRGGEAGGESDTGGRGSRASRGGRRRGRQGGNEDGTGVSSTDPYQQNNTSNRFRRQAEFEHETDGGIRIIDDDLGMLYEANNQFGNTRGNGGGGGGGSGYRNSLGFGGYNDGIANRSRYGNGSGGAVEAFPSLAASAAEALADSNNTIAGNGNTATGGGGGATGSRRPPPLVKHTLRCPCGRRVTYPVIEEGQPVPEIQCDAVCRLEGRKKTLADAFGVENPDKYISSFERRHAVWSGLLLDAAKRNPAWVETIEKELANFIANQDLKRHALPAMSRAQRAVVYGMAEQYGIASAAMGVEPRRYIELFKTGDNVGLPSKLLTKMALTISEKEISAMLDASAGFPIRFVEITPTTDLQYYLRRWEPRFKVEWQGGSQATVTFEKEDEMKEALDTFGGGIRGLFRVDRSWHPRTGVSTIEAASKESHIAPWAEGSAGGTGAGSSGASTSSGQWRAVAGSTSSIGAGRRSVMENGHGDEGDGSRGSSTVAVPTGWAVIGGKKAVKPRTVTATAVGNEAPRAQFSALNLADTDDNWN